MRTDRYFDQKNQPLKNTNDEKPSLTRSGWFLRQGNSFLIASPKQSEDPKTTRINFQYNVG